ncbi:ATP synthase F1 subunit gamma [Alienimonas californiensis]|uniref:ATP synthase gamma chain n=1 Tax=Alienimonas californiensis TaxID=2527989 RepID=A0A517PBF9_9PLAN|nr:ATP synthase F1 subunit gamma [Alienimonas californiensis]QDT16718.1 ATP synthase gamma chain [Alienimonas californiensis]
MANARAIVKRLKSVKNIRKITRTMELIATARFKKAQDRATEAAAYTRKIGEVVADLAAAGGEISHPLLKEPENEAHVTVLVLTSNRGLCGGFNAGVLRKAMGRIREVRAQAGVGLEIEVSGKRGISYMKFQGVTPAEKYTQFEDQPAYADVDAIADRYVREFLNGNLDRLDVAYQKYVSSGRQEPVVETLLPLTGLADAAGQQAAPSAGGRKVNYEFLPNPNDILDEIVPAAFKARLFKCFLDSAVSEQIARMVAMKGATENADEMIGDLSQKYNRARQAQITNELAEVIGGAAALE